MMKMNYSIAQVTCFKGLTEEQLKEKGIVYSKGSFPFMANSRARTVSDYEGSIKVLADKETDRILGVHIIGSNAGISFLGDFLIF